MRRRRRSDERGIAVIYLSLTITCVLLAAAFAVDLGFWYLRASQAQRAADAAALAGVTWMPGDFPKARSVALTSAQANGFTDGVDDVSVQVARGASDRQLAVRIVDAGVDRFFSSVASNDRVTIGKGAVAQYELPVPLGSPENQFGGGTNGVFLAVSGFCSRRQDGDNRSSAYNDTTNPKDFNGAVITCPTPYATPSGGTAKNPDYRTSGYTYVVTIPPAQAAGCAVASPPPQCSETADAVTIQWQDPRLNTDLASRRGDQYGPYFPYRPSGCSATPPGTTIFTVLKPDATPFDDGDNPTMAGGGPFVLAAAPQTVASSTAWTTMATVPAGAKSGRYLIRVRSQADEACAVWSNAFGIRAHVGASWSECSTIPGSVSFSAGCPQVHGSDAMSLRVVMDGASDTCAAAVVKEVPTNKCVSFFLAQVDPAYAGREMVIKLFDPGEGARRMRVLAPNGSPLGFTYKTTDLPADGPSRSGTATPTGLDVFDPPARPTEWPFNDRKLELSVALPDAAGLSVNGGWFKVEYEVSDSGVVGLVDRTTWGVSVRGAPVHLVQ